MKFVTFTGKSTTGKDAHRLGVLAEEFFDHRRCGKPAPAADHGGAVRPS